MMRKFVAACLLIAFTAHPVAAARPSKKPVSAPVSAPGVPVEIELEGFPVADVVSLVYRDLLRVPFALSPEVYADRRPVTVRFRSDDKNAREAFRAYLGTLGFTVRTAGGMDHVKPAPAPVEPPVPTTVFVYKPKYRDAGYLASVLRPAFTQVAVSGGGSASIATPRPAEMGSQSPTSSGALMDQRADAVVFNGPVSDINRLKAMLAEVDTPQGELMIRATVYEVSTGTKDGSAFQLAASLLNKVSPNIQIGINTGGAPSDSFIRFKSGSIDAVLSAFATDDRFNIVTSPTVRARSGSETSFKRGNQVPVLGEVSYAGVSGSVPVQSVVYRDSGIIFRVLPTVRTGVIDLDVTQELSDFVPTSTGVNNSPTLNQRSLQSHLSVQEGEIVILGGLTEDRKVTNTRSLPVFSFVSESVEQVQRTEILLVLQVVGVR